MAIDDRPRRAGPFTGNGVTISFPYDFKVFDAADLRVVSRSPADLVFSTLDPSDYVVTGVGSEEGGAIILNAPLPDGDILVALGDASYDQPLVLVNQGPYFAEDVMRALDRTVVLTQQLREEVDRSVRIPVEADSQLLDTLIPSIIRLAGSADNVDTVAGIADDVVSVAGFSADISTVASISGSIVTVADIAASVTAVAANDVNIDIVAGSIANVNAVGASIADVSSVASIASDVTSVASGISDVVVVSSAITDVSAVTAIAADVSTVAGIDADVAAVAVAASDIPTVAANIADVTNFAHVYVGPSASNPSTRNNGSALQAGDLYFNTAFNEMRAYDGAAWVSLVEGAVAQTGPTGAALIPVGTEAQRPSPAAGQLRFNSDAGSFEGYNGVEWGSIGGGAVDDLFYENAQVVANNYTIPTGRNAMTTGPIDVNPGVVVTVSAGSRWVII